MSRVRTEDPFDTCALFWLLVLVYHHHPSAPRPIPVSPSPSPHAPAIPEPTVGRKQNDTTYTLKCSTCIFVWWGFMHPMHSLAPPPPTLATLLPGFITCIPLSGLDLSYWTDEESLLILIHLLISYCMNSCSTGRRQYCDGTTLFTQV